MYPSVNPRFQIVRQTLKEMFLESGIGKDDHVGIVNLFSPENVAGYLGLAYERIEEIPSGSLQFKTAGLLDRHNKRIVIANCFPPEQQRLTGMHEIIHWMLHADVGLTKMHRDRPIGFLPKKEDVPYFEWEATHLACLALMPEKMVKKEFAIRFGLGYGVPLEFDENAAFYLAKDIEDLRKKGLKEKAFLLASTNSYGRPIVPLSQQFKVSPTAMAIRLQELNLLAPDRWRGKPNLRLIK